jgi:molybdopterin/thiamine biosynthesis adenylyltransferase
MGAGIRVMDFTRQLKQLNPDMIGKKKAVLVGAGATGSYVAYILAKLGWGDSSAGHGVLSVWDGDVVEDHNLCNQLYEPTHVGKAKVEALDEIIFRACGFHIDTHCEMVTDQQDLREGKYIFLLTDTMKSRSEIFEKCIQYSFNTDLVIETRMGLGDGRVYAFNPNNMDETEAWKRTLYSDEEASESLCGASSSIVATAMFTASLAVWRLLHHFDVTYGENFTKAQMKDEALVNETLFALGPEFMMNRKFGVPSTVDVEA